MDSIRVTFLLLFWLHHCRMFGSKVILTATEGTVSVPGGYGVPQNGSITLKCHATMYPSITSLHWNITLNGSTSVRGSGGTLSISERGKYSVPDGLQTENPTLLRIHNLQIHENGSSVQCAVPDLSGVYVASSQAKVVFVEGAPLCPKISITNTLNSIINWSPASHVLLPITYTIAIKTLSGESVLLLNTSQTQFNLTGRSIPTLTNYTVTMVACTRAGCSQNCDYMWFSMPPKAESSSVPRGNTGIIIVAAVVTCILVGIGIMVAVVIVSWCLVHCQRSKSRGMYRADSEHEYAMVCSHTDGTLKRADLVQDTAVDTTQIVMHENPSYATVHARAVT